MKRREFLKSSALAASTIVTPVKLFQEQAKIKIAMVGTGWWGTDFLLPNILSCGRFEVVGLCDVNQVSLQRAAEVVVAASQPVPKLFADYRQMYDIPNLEAVVIATPPHWHALQFVAACEKGLHVFLEKPICYDIREAQAMLIAHQKAANVVQVDFPRVQLDTNDQVKSYIAKGAAGKILQAKANIYWNEGTIVKSTIPDHLDYDAFCGPAPRVDFMTSPEGNTPQWRGQHAFSRGILADWGIHYIHNARKVLGLDLPTQVSAMGGTVKNFSQDNPDYLDVKFDFDGFPLHWTHQSWGSALQNPDTTHGVFYYGEKATIYASDLGWEVYPADGTDKIVHGQVRFTADESWLESGMMAIQKLFIEFAQGIDEDSNESISAPLHDAYQTTASVIYADVAFLTESKLQIDAKTMGVLNNQQAQSMLKREYRASYQHPFA
jgi:predicted dehydrogenase